MKKSRKKVKQANRYKGVGFFGVSVFVILIILATIYLGGFLQSYFNAMSQDVIGIDDPRYQHSQQPSIELNRPRNLNPGNMNLND